MADKKRQRGAIKGNLTAGRMAFAEIIAYQPSIQSTAAYRKVFDCSNMTKPTVARAAYSMRHMKCVVKHVALLRQERADRTAVDADWLLQRLEEETVADLADIYDKEGGLLPIHEWPMIWRQGLVSGIDSIQEYEYIGKEKVPAGIVKKVRFSDRVKRLELMGKHIDVQAFNERQTIDLSSDDTLADLLQKARGGD